MIACGFKEENCVLDLPDGVGPEECEPLSAYRGLSQDGRPVLVSCWKVTAAELAEINRTGRVWLLVSGHGAPPVALSGINPFSPEAADGQ